MGYLGRALVLRITGLAKAMLEEGILYFNAGTTLYLPTGNEGANLVNLVMFLNPDITAQSSAAVFGQAVTMIMSQRIILSLQKWFSEPTHGHSSRSRSAPDYAMHVLGNTAGGARGMGTGAGLGTGSGAHSQTALPSKSNNAWSEPGNKGTRSTGWEGLKATQHVRQASSGIFNVGTENVAELHVVVEREVRYDHDAISESEKSLADVKK
ncbi:hypothetical protein CTheo_6475 [Ceratobasidium theobromae]|uniref:Uncharacterized protein n=1 Tax=Ceratobasidium theobromae TaxID=1582974 RepID=A0A5N5QEB2_9AGAM|nr:hypothetical protein CTheo_6475 [Ceratobasidium theobromae]